MADLLPVIETLENRWMRAWAGRDLRTLKALTSRNFMLLAGSKPPVILDARSWLEAAGTRWVCSGYRFGDIYVRQLGATALFACEIEWDAKLDGHDWSGRVWVTDLWRRSAVRRSWRMIERVVSRPETDTQVPGAIRSMQLWR
jgi:hypothetical protein